MDFLKENKDGGKVCAVHEHAACVRWLTAPSHRSRPLHSHMCVCTGGERARRDAPRGPAAAARPEIRSPRRTGEIERWSDCRRRSVIRDAIPLPFRLSTAYHEERTLDASYIHPPSIPCHPHIYRYQEELDAMSSDPYGLQFQALLQVTGRHCHNCSHHYVHCAHTSLCCRRRRIRRGSTSSRRSSARSRSGWRRASSSSRCSRGWATPERAESILFSYDRISLLRAFAACGRARRIRRLAQGSCEGARALERFSCALQS